MMVQIPTAEFVSPFWEKFMMWPKEKGFMDQVNRIFEIPIIRTVLKSFKWFYMTHPICCENRDLSLQLEFINYRCCLWPMFFKRFWQWFIIKNNVKLVIFVRGNQLRKCCIGLHEIFQFFWNFFVALIQR